MRADRCPIAGAWPGRRLLAGLLRLRLPCGAAGGAGCCRAARAPCAARAGQPRLAACLKCAPARRSISSSTSARPAAAFCSQAPLRMLQLAKGDSRACSDVCSSTAAVPNRSCAVQKRGRAARATQDTTTAASVECCPHGRGTARAARRRQRHRTSRGGETRRLHACHSAGAKRPAPHPAPAARAAPQPRENALCSPLTSANACLRDGSGTPPAQAAPPPAQMRSRPLRPLLRALFARSCVCRESDAPSSAAVQAHGCGEASSRGRRRPSSTTIAAAAAPRQPQSSGALRCSTKPTWALLSLACDGSTRLGGVAPAHEAGVKRANEPPGQALGAWCTPATETALPRRSAAPHALSRSRWCLTSDGQHCGTAGGARRARDGLDRVGGNGPCSCRPHGSALRYRLMAPAGHPGHPGRCAGNSE
jgi:hypothetical protein